METAMHGPAGIDAKAALTAAFVAGAVFMVLEMLMVALFLGQSAWAPPRMIAAMLMGRDVLPPPATFDLTVMIVAMLIHFLLSVVLAFVFALLAKGKSVGTAILIGAVFGLVVYVINFYGMTTVFSWFANARNWVSILVHVVFGVVLGWVYASRAHRTARTSAAH